MGRKLRGYWCVVLVAVVMVLAGTARAADYTVSQESSNGYASAPTVGQSFTTGDEGILERVDVYLSVNHETSTVTLRIYAGDTNLSDPSQAVCEQVFTSVPTDADQWYSFVLAEGGCRIVLSAASQYTLQLDGPSNSATRWQTTDPYAGGIFYNQYISSEFPGAHPGNDMAFRVHLTSPVPVELQSFSAE